MVYEKVASLFNYAGDWGRGRYSAGYSPNNIRTVVISPNGVLVRYHLPIPGGKRRSYLQFSEVELYREEARQDYKPILSMLARPLVCASVEEIVVLRNSLSGNTNDLFTSEANLESAVKSLANRGSDLKENVMRRFPRLRYYTVLSLNYRQFMGVAREALECEFLTDFAGFDGYKAVTELAGSDDWWRHDGCLQVYNFDNERLKPHFDAIRDRKEKELRDAKIKDMADSRLASRKEECDKLVEEYKSCVRLVLKYNKLGGLPLPPELVVPVYMYKDMPYVNGKLLRKDDNAIEKNIASLKGYKARLCMELAKTLSSVARGDYWRAVVSTIDRRASLPDGVSLGAEFSKAGVDVTLETLFLLLVRYSVDSEIPDIYKRGCWVC